MLVGQTALVTSTAFGQDPNPITFTNTKATVEGAIQLYWNSNPNEVYDIEYADELVDVSQGETVWHTLYSQYPSHGTNTFIADCGNYDVTPEIPHPRKNASNMRFYRVKYVESGTLPSNPTITITAPTNGEVLSGKITVSVNANSDNIISTVKLYIDGEEQWPSDDGTNFVINTTEYANGPHVLFATVRAQSDYEGAANGPVIYYGWGVSPYVNVTFDNLISRFDFSENFFEPELGQTQIITALFAANCNWTLHIRDGGGNDVRVVTGSGKSMRFDWDGNGENGAALPNGKYNFWLDAVQNGLASVEPPPSSGGGSVPSLPVMPDSFMAEFGDIYVAQMMMQAEAQAQQLNAMNTTMSKNSTAAFVVDTPVAPRSAASSQGSDGAARKPKIPIRGAVGTFGICYKTYEGGFRSQHPLTGWPYPLTTYVAIDGQSATAMTSDGSLKALKDTANGFSTGMKMGGWKPAFIKGEGEWGANDIKKTSLGGMSIFNTCNFGIYMGHGSYATALDSGSVLNTYVWLGANNYVRLQDMSFGSPGTNGLKWMTLDACNLLRPECVTSMTSRGVMPINGNLHLLMGSATTTYAVPNLGGTYAAQLHTNTIPMAWFTAGYQCFNNTNLITTNITSVVTWRTIGWQPCFNDTLDWYYDPDTSGSLYKQDYPVFTPK